MYIKQKIKHHFFLYPNSKLRVRELERTLKLPLPSVIRYCRELKEEKILKTITIGKTVFYTADRVSKSFLLEKKLFNIKSIYESKLIEHLKRELHNPVIILFGSYSKGEDVEESDIDLYIESKTAINTDFFENKLKRKIQIHNYNNIKQVNPHLANNIINGITLNGQLEVFHGSRLEGVPGKNGKKNNTRH